MIDFDKPVQTRDGHEARIHGAVLEDGVWRVRLWYENGRTYLQSESPYDLVNVPKRDAVYVNVYEGERVLSAHSSRADADSYASFRRIACIRVEFEEGQFDD